MRLLSRVEAVRQVIRVGAFVFMIAFAGAARAAPANTEPYLNSTYDTQLRAMLLAKWPNAYSANEQALPDSTLGNQIRSGLARARMEAGALPSFGRASPLIWRTGGFSNGWRIDRGFDEKWIHLSGDPGFGGFEPQSVAVLGAIAGARFEFYCGGNTTYVPSTCWGTMGALDGRQWVLKSLFSAGSRMAILDMTDCDSPYGPGTKCGLGVSAEEYARTNNMYSLFGPPNGASVSGSLSPPWINNGRCNVYYGNQFNNCWFRVVSEQSMPFNVDFDRFETMVSQPYDSYTQTGGIGMNIAADGSSLDLPLARAALADQRNDAARWWVNYQLDNSYPSPLPSITLSASPTQPQLGSSVTLTARAGGLEAIAGAPVHFSISGANPQNYTVDSESDGTAQFEYWPTRPGQDSAIATATIGTTDVSSTPVAVTSSGIDCSGNPASLRDQWPGSTRSYYIRYLSGMSNTQIARHYRDVGKALGQEIRTNSPRVGSPADSCPSTIAVILHFGAQTRLASGAWGVIPTNSGLKHPNAWAVNLAFAFGQGFYDGTGSYQQAYLRLVLGANDNNGTLKRAVDSRDRYLKEDGTPIPENAVTTRCTTSGGGNIPPGTHDGYAFVACKDPSTPADCDVTNAPNSHFERMYCAGIAWGGVVESVNAKLRTIHALHQVAASGGLDGEADFCNKRLHGINAFRNTICGEAARSWVTGFGARATRSLLVNYGDCAGCRAFANAGANANTDASSTWSIGDRFFAAAPPQGRARSLPQIYGDHQLDWLALARWGNDTARGSDQRKMIFIGALTQFGSCTQVGCLSGTMNTPQTGWQNLHDAFASEPDWLRTQRLWYSSDMYSCENTSGHCTNDTPSGD